MDGWYVRQLLLQRDNIKSNIVNADESSDAFFIDFENDTYYDLLLVEKELKRLAEEALFSSRDLFILEYMSFNPTPIAVIAKKLNISRATVNNSFRRSCSVVAKNLGGKFTNDGFIAELLETKTFSDDEVKKIKDYMER